MSRRHRCVVITADYVPVARISPERALIHVMTNKAVLIYAQEGEVFRSAKQIWPVPAIIRLKRVYKLPGHFYGGARLTTHTLAKRDNWTCQYCGRKKHELRENEFLTRDHVFPVSRGGEDIWENVVTACITCNNRKSDKTPEEAGMKLLRAPKAPRREELHSKAMEIVRKVDAGEIPMVDLDTFALDFLELEDVDDLDLAGSEV